MANVIYRGPQGSQPRTVSDKPVAAALLPGTFVLEGAATLTQATSAQGLLRILSNRDFYASFSAAFSDLSPLKQPYKAGETGVAYVLEPSHQYHAAMAAGAYTYGLELTVDPAGRLTAAVDGYTVVAHFDQPGKTVVAGELADVTIANFYTL